MKIVQVHSAFFPVIGGVTNYIYSLCKEMVKAGHEVTVITSTIGTNKKVGVEELEGIEITRLKPAFRIGGTPIIPGLFLELRRVSADIIHTHLPTPYVSDVACFMAKRKNMPCVLTYHNDIVGSGMKNYIAKVYNLVALKTLLNNADKIISTQPGYMELSPHLKNYKHKIEVIPPAVDVDKFKPLSIEREENSIFFLSLLNRAHRYKGLDYLLKALAQVKKEISNIKLIVGGTGELINYYQQIAKSLGLEETVEFHGFIPDEELIEYYNKCSIFVLPSISSAQEGFGIVLLEALACGTPVIATDIVGVAKDVESSNAGIVVQPQDTQALASAIVKVLGDANLSIEMGRNGRKLVEKKYTWGKIANEVLNLYEALV